MRAAPFNYCLTLFLLVSVQAADEFVSPRGQYKGDLGKKLNDYMEKAERDGFSGAILVERGGEVVIASGYGWSNQAKQQPFTKDTIFDIGSITKQFTAAGILKLQEAGKLDVRDAMSKYLPNVPQDKLGITLHHLLTHTSGMMDSMGDDYDKMTRETFLEKALSSPLRWKPGEKYAYSNAGYSILGAIIEIVSGKGYEEYLHDHLFKPSGMEHTGYLIPKWDRDNIVHLYRKGDDWGTMLDHPWLPDGPGWNLRCNGGILSTLEDLRKWHRALLGETVLGKSSKELIFASHVPESARGSSYYGYGWAITATSRGTRLVAHNGGNGIFTTDFRRYVDEDTLVIMTASVAEKPLGPCERGALDIIFPPSN